jgi:hypothetical protein
MRTRVARSVVLVLLLAGAASFSVAGQSQSPAAPSRRAASTVPAAQLAKRPISKKAAANPGRLSNIRTPQQIDLTIHFK